MEGLHHLIADWGSFYANHAAVRTLVAFVHVAALTIGGGAAVTSDWRLLKVLRRDQPARLAELAALRGWHRTVAAGLALIAVSGVLLFAADFDAYFYSRVFWIKMGLTALLVANGALLLSAERRASQGNDAWPALRRTTMASLTLWLLTTLTGVALPNIG
jgi:uncharacterized membrane protein